MAKTLEQRREADGKSSHHTLKLALGDGRQTVMRDGSRTVVEGCPEHHASRIIDDEVNRDLRRFASGKARTGSTTLFMAGHQPRCSRLLISPTIAAALQVTAFEYRRIQGLPADPPPGLKVLVIEPWVRRGILLLTSDNAIVLGGEV